MLLGGLSFLCTTITLVVIYGIKYLLERKGKHISRPGVAFCLGLGLTIFYHILFISIGI